MGSTLARVVLLALVPVPAAGQSLEQRVTGIGSGTVHLSYPARPDVCANGNRASSESRDHDWEEGCEPQPVRVAVEVQSHRVTQIRAHVGGRWRPNASAVDLGSVRPQEAADFFLRLVQQPAPPGGEPLVAAALADSAVIWPALLTIARSPRNSLETRRSAVFWLSQAAGAAVGPVLDSIASDPRGERELRRQAVFALSQRASEEAVPALIRIARHNPDPEIRRSALFWLGQSEDPRALALFEELLK